MSHGEELFKQPGAPIKGNAAETRIRLEGFKLGAWRRSVRLSWPSGKAVERYCRITA